MSPRCPRGASATTFLRLVAIAGRGADISPLAGEKRSDELVFRHAERARSSFGSTILWVQRSRQVLPFNECRQHALQLNLSLLSACFPVLELDPTFVEAVEHPNARSRVLHALRLEEVMPGLARDGFHSDGMIREPCESGCDFIGSDAARPFEFDDPPAAPRLLKPFGR